MLKHFIAAGLLLAIEAWVGIGLIGGSVGMIAPIIFVILALAEKQRRSEHFRVAAIYALLFIATMAVLSSNARIAQRRATSVIAAVNRYHSEHGHYPTSLNELVPAYLPSIPNAGFTRISRHFGYFDEGPQLYFAGMFHGVFAYDFPTASWRTNE